MNKSFLLILFGVFFISLPAAAQEYSFGIKGGANYAMGGEIIANSSAGIYDGGTYHPESKIGFHAGVFFQLKFGNFFVRPEAMYNTISTQFNFPTQPSLYSVEKLSIPLLFGYSFGDIDVYAGPAYQNIMSSSLEGTEPPNQVIVAQNTPLAAQVGVKYNWGRFEIDLRYDRTMASKENQSLDILNREYGVNRADFTDTRLNQLLLSIGFKIGDSEANPRRRRGRGCYF